MKCIVRRPISVPQVTGKVAKVNTTEQQKKKNQLPEEMHQTNILWDKNVNQPPAIFVTEFRNNDIFQAITQFNLQGL